MARLLSSRLAALALAVSLGACETRDVLDPALLARGPGGMVGTGTPINTAPFRGGSDVLPAARAVAPPDDARPPDCDAACIAWCDAQSLENPVHKGLCRSLWGVGLEPREIDTLQACRRLYVDLTGRLPTLEEANATCSQGWDHAVNTLLASEAFVKHNQRRWADKLLYSIEVVNIERVYDADRLVGKFMRGEIPYDLFASVVSAHPVLTRRHASPGDRVEALFLLFMGRPPFENERADLGRLYNLWHNGYVDHVQLGRVPDAFLHFRCLTEDLQIDEDRRGECTSVLYGFNEIIFTPDIRANFNPDLNATVLWSGLLNAEEWSRLQMPGRVLSQQVAFWEQGVEEVLEQYLGYDLARLIPEVRDQLVRWLIDHGGDIRSVHHAVLTSVAYLQSTDGLSSAAYPWTRGPLKQVDAEVWLNSLAHMADRDIGDCDHRISNPRAFLSTGSINAYRIVDASDWRFSEPDENGRSRGVDMSYAEVARTLGGCPENLISGRFKVLSILTTATQLGFVQEICDPGMKGSRKAAPIARLLPEGVTPNTATTPDLARRIAAHQQRLFFGREPTEAELTDAAEAGAECAAAVCTAEAFARPYCFAALSSAEMLFY